ncbi:hypothetical protein Tco_1268400, partial [Tanacetum coccineum]
TEPLDKIHHECNPLRFKNGTAIWPTCNWKEDGYCNTGDLIGFIRNRNSIRYEDYEWYDTIEDSESKEEALNNKKILEESMNVIEESSDDKWDHDSPVDELKDHEHITYIKTDDDDDDISDLEHNLIQKDPPCYVNEEEERSKKRRCKLLGIPYVKPPTCKTEKFKVVKYLFGPAEEYVAITKYEYDI